MKFNNLLYKDLPVFNIVLNDDDETQGLSVVSIVDDPAVCQSLFCFKNEEKKPMMFVDEKNEQHCITSVAILADVPIYRYDASMGEYYVVFEKQTIRDLVEKYSKDNYNNLVSFQHNGKIVNDFIMLESYFVDKEKGIAPTQFDVPDGSWMVTYKCTNDDTWEMVKNELATGGYSIEILCDIEPAPATQEIFDEPEPVYDEDEEFMNWLDELLKALEDADYDVEFENSKKKVETDDWDLGFEVERTDIAKLVNKGVKINNTDFWVYGIGKDSGKDAAILYDPAKSKYVIMPLKDIKQFEPLKAPVGEFPPLPNEIVDDDNITVQKTINSGSYSDLIHNRITCIINYNDEQQPASFTGARQCLVIAWGLSEAQNEVIRVYESFGTSRSAAMGEDQIPNFRLLRTDRIISLKPMYGTQPYGRDMLDSRTNFEGDKSMHPCYDHIIEADFIV